MVSMRVWGFGLTLLAPLLALAVPPAVGPPRNDPATETDLSHVPRGLPAPPAPPTDNPLTLAKVRLGRRLFFDPVLSGDRTVSCASCHDPARGFAGADAVAVGIGGRRGRRHAPSLLNMAYGSSFFWDGRAATLEEQALQPIADPSEMGANVDEVVGRLRADAEYAARFREAFGGEATAPRLAQALASFERTLLSGDSPLDRFRAGEFTALRESERQGLWLFESRGGCWRCHSGPNLSDGRFHNTGVGWGAEPPDPGRYAVTRRESDRGAFKTPTLRGAARAAPYMHDGSLKSLEEVVRYYRRGGNPNPALDPAIKPLDLSEDDVRHLVAFLRALTGAPGR